MILRMIASSQNQMRQCVLNITLRSFVFTAIVCPEISQIGNAQVVVANRTYLSKADVICDPGLRLDDGSTQTTVTCRSDATWSKTNITCQGISYHSFTCQ